MESSKERIKRQHKKRIKRMKMKEKRNHQDLNQNKEVHKMRD
jgi:hypothetical protein